MLENKSNYSESIKKMTHGRPSNNKDGRSHMYEIFNWNSPSKSQINTHQRQRNCPVPEQYLHQNQKEIKKCNGQREQNQNEQFYPENYEKVQNSNPISKIHKKGHQIKDKLYMIEHVKLKKSNSVDLSDTRQTNKNQRISVKKPKKLDINNEKDRKIIQERQQRINEFKYFTRDLPNSAFTTYYGKPTFENYGRCSSNILMKTHNVMPHSGQNRPNQPQSYFNALQKAKKLNYQNNLPRKPLRMKSQIVDAEGEGQPKNFHIPMQKPDLINHVRFSDPELKKTKKEGIPAQTPIVKKKVYQKPKKTRNKKKNKNKSLTNFNDGLKYMNMRTDLLQLLEKKKTKDSKLAYKVTQCYPYHLDWENQRQCNVQQTRYQKFQQMRPAGKIFAKGDDAKTVIYQKLKKKQSIA